ncbi:MAG TPA: A/G-specific adenine glycosylase [Tepidisphaeraceae bacterium]|jgi:A/G-specific adenine glycosylase|nr:A/G-specific adenine glycosylase [Tepidisphaeraceae bacterium]
MRSPGPTFTPRLLRWYDKNRRELPWRRPAASDAPLDPYHVLLSETMLQQTQVVTVIPYFHRFLERFPTLNALADAPRQDVLRLWQGLGYYSRARNLQAAAQMIVRELNGQIPTSVDELLKLPGVGRYTAGAIASIAFDRRAPILDGNVQRVLCRLDCVKDDPRNREINQRLWQRAGEILPSKRIGDFNSALMELGATICTPRNPQCLRCPVHKHCEALAAEMQEIIPLAKKAVPTPLVHRQTFCIRHGNRWLIEQRPASGRWAAMWQFVTLACEPPTSENAVRLPVETSPPQPLLRISHTLTHRRYRFEVFTCDAVNDYSPVDVNPRRWMTLRNLHKFPLPKPHVKIADALRQRR